MDVILLEKVRNLGDLGETVKVKSGYGRNFLLPYGKAVPATKENIAKFEAQHIELEKKAKQELQQATERAEKLHALQLTIPAMASEEGKLYGSVSVLEIAKAIQEAGHEIEKKEIIMPEGPIHEIGEYEINLQLHSDVTTQIKIEIVLSK